MIGLPRAFLAVAALAAALLAAPAGAQTYRETAITYHAAASAHRGLPNTVTVIDPAGVDPSLVTSFTWTDAGDIDTLTNPESVVTNADYDIARRLTQIVHNPGGPARATTTSAFLYDEAGRLEVARAKATASTWLETVVSYTDAGRVEAIADPANDATGFTYDAASRLDVLTDPEGRQTKTTYFSDGAVRCVRDGWQTASPRAYQHLDHDIWKSTSAWWPAKADPDDDCEGLDNAYRTQVEIHSPFGEIDKLAFPDGSDTRASYDKAGNVIERRTRAGEVIAHQYDASNRLVSKLAPVSASGAPGRDELYGYDRTGAQVCAAVHPAGTTVATDTCAAKTGFTHRLTNAYDYGGRLKSETSDRGGIARTATWSSPSTTPRAS